MKPCSRKSGVYVVCPLLEVLKWRVKQGGSLAKISREFDQLATTGKVVAEGLFSSHPDRPEQPQPIGPEAFKGLPHSLGLNAPRLGVITNWFDVKLEVVEKKFTGNLEYTDCHLVAWDHVEVDRDELRAAWLALLDTAPRPKRRGPAPKTREQSKERMLAHLRSGERSVVELGRDTLEALEKEYKASKNTAKAARDEAIEQYHSEIQN